MDMLKRFFPLSFSVADVTALVVNIIIYIVVSVVVGFVCDLLNFIPVVGLLLSIVSWAVGLYCTVGVVLALLVFFKVVK